MIKNNYCVGLVSPSAPLPGLFPERFERGVKALENTGYKVALGDNVKAIGTSKENRANDINQLFGNPAVDIIMATIGGETASDILPFLNWDVIESNPKHFIGYSDISVLLHAIGIKGKQVVYYGPTLMTEVAEYPVPPRISMDYFNNSMNHDSAEYTVCPNDYLFAKGTDWALPPTERKTKINVLHKTIQNGKAEGVVLGGCLEALERIRGTEYWPDFTGAILAIETVEDNFIEDNWQKFITDYSNMHVLEKISGLIIGQKAWDEDDINKLSDILLSARDIKDKPIVYGLPFGHISPISTIPMYATATLNADQMTLTYKRPFQYSYLNKVR